MRLSQFTKDPVQATLNTFRQLDGKPFAYLRGLTSASDVYIDSCDAEDDTLMLGGYSIQVREGERPSVAGPRPCVEFAVFGTVTRPGSYWEPEDADIVELATLPSFGAALAEVVCQEVMAYVDNIIVSDSLAATEE